MARAAPAGPPPAPVAQRLVIRYAKRGRMRFASHRDIARAVERGVRIAGLPIAYSAGFSPHPRISYAGGAQTGTASEAEYLEIALTGPCAAADVRDRLDAALPSGIDVIDVFEMASATPAGRPDDILTALREHAGLAPSSPPQVTRLAQGPLPGMEAADATAPAPGPPGPAGPGGATADAGPSGRRAAQGQ